MARRLRANGARMTASLLITQSTKGESMNDYNATAISIGVVICGAMFLLFLYLRDYTLFFDRLFGTMEPEEYYKEKNYIGLYKRFKHCMVINGLGWSWKTSAEIAEICRFASLAGPE